MDRDYKDDGLIIRGIVNALIGRYIKLGTYAAKYGDEDGAPDL